MTTLEPLDRPNWLPRSAWPWPTGSLATPAGRIAVTDAGSGPPLLLVHTGTWSFVWRDLLRALTPQFRCIALDAPGCGRSERLSTHRATLAASAAAVGSVIDRLDLHGLTLVAHDLGGLSGLAAAAERPERIHGIVAVNTFGWRPASPALRGALAVMGSPPMRELDALTGWLPRLASSAFGVGRHLSRADRAVFRAGVDRPARRALHDYFADAHRADDLYQRIHGALHGPLADRPLLTVFGQLNDPFRFQRQWQARFPQARQHVVRRGNHYPMCDDPTGVAETILHWHATEVAPSSFPTTPAN
jgi:pimeloyl-ACP methyl ester carboxylesterase